MLLREGYTTTDTIDPSEVRWKRLDEEEKPPFYVVQLPGSNNALGRIKFMFPNNHAIYLHDTPADHLFEIERRDFSHGCIRLERPIELAGMLLKNQLDDREIDKILENEKTAEIPLENKVPVHFMYNTAWVDDEGLLHFRNDIYHIDKQAISLFQKP